MPATVPTGTVAIRETLPPGQVEAAARLLSRVAEVDGPSGIERPDLDRLGDAVAVTVGDDAMLALALVGPARDGWEVAVAVDPSARVPGSDVGELLCAAVRDHIAGAGGGTVHLWLHRPRPSDERLAAALGLSPVRSLYQVRRPLPVEAAVDSGDRLTTRSFRPGADEEAWVEVNNRAFAWHREQSGWTTADVTAREAEAWFDPDGFLLHEVDGRLAGFCWTKIHRDVDPAQGEIYIIAVDPELGGRGLGRGLVLAGLDSLARRGITIGMLYVDGSNVGAVKLYADLGFEVHHVDVQHAGTIAP